MAHAIACTRDLTHKVLFCLPCMHWGQYISSMTGILFMWRSVHLRSSSLMHATAKLQSNSPWLDLQSVDLPNAWFKSDSASLLPAENPLSSVELMKVDFKDRLKPHIMNMNIWPHMRHAAADNGARVLSLALKAWVDETKNQVISSETSALICWAITPRSLLSNSCQLARCYHCIWHLGITLAVGTWRRLQDGLVQHGRFLIGGWICLSVTLWFGWEYRGCTARIALDSESLCQVYGASMLMTLACRTPPLHAKTPHAINWYMPLVGKAQYNAVIIYYLNGSSKPADKYIASRTTSWHEGWNYLSPKLAVRCRMCCRDSSFLGLQTYHQMKILLRAALQNATPLDRLLPQSQPPLQRHIALCLSSDRRMCLQACKQ